MAEEVKERVSRYILDGADDVHDDDHVHDDVHR
jgi:hypothetical protein